MLNDAHKMLLATRLEHPRAGGLIVCADQGHARQMAQCIAAISGEKPTVVLSDDGGASKKIKQFSDDAHMWLVACNMVSEGVDIPRLRVGVYTTTTRTKLYFRQFVGRIVRRQQNIPGLQVSYLYVPADPTLHRLAEEIEVECKHSLKAVRDSIFDEDAQSDRARPGPHERTWTALGSTNSGVDAVIVHGSQLALFGDATAPEQVRAVVDREVEMHIEDRLTRTEEKSQIATEIKRLVGLVHRQSGKPHSVIHTTLNKSQRVRSQVHCTEQQLRERLGLLHSMISGGARESAR
jgi:superfamily II DNA or RNA helicase